MVSTATLLTMVPPFLQPTSVCLRIANVLLGRDVWVRERLAAFSGRTVRLVVGPFSAQASISAVGELIPTASEVMPDVTLTLPSDKLSVVPQLLREGDPAAIANLMHVEGDAGLAALVSEVAQSVNVDVEADLARFVGDIAAVRIVSGAKGFVKAGQRSATHLSANLGEYLGEESEWLVSRGRYSLWENQMQSLTAALTRVESSVARFEQQAKTHGKGR